jgi:sensor histidine kinase YesM
MLRIRLREWLYILLLASLLGFSISGFVASLHGQRLMPVMFLGLITSLYIFVLSFITTEINNRWLVRMLPDFLRTPFSLFLALVSGFLGAMGGYLTNEALGIVDLHLPMGKALSLSVFLGLMTASLGYLLYKLVSLQRREEESKRLLLEEHIRNLESQISPHFMFNTLNALAELVHQDPGKAEEAILALARLLRRSLHFEPLISLEDELNLLRDYWKVISLRFVGKIDLVVKVDEGLLSLKVPKFSLQVLVENALKHGLKLRHGRVEVRAYTEGNRKIVEVVDNGVGFEHIREGTGLSNLRKRLELCGGRLSYRRDKEVSVFRMEFSEE